MPWPWPACPRSSRLNQPRPCATIVFARQEDMGMTKATVRKGEGFRTPVSGAGGWPRAANCPENRRVDPADRLLPPQAAGMSCYSVAEAIMPGRADFRAADAVLRNRTTGAPSTRSGMPAVTRRHRQERRRLNPLSPTRKSARAAANFQVTE